MPGIFAELIHLHNVPVVWPLVKPKLQQLFDEWENPDCTVGDLFVSLCEGRSQLWILNDKDYNIKMVCVTRILNYPHVKRLMIDMAVGEDIKDAIELIDKAEAWASRFGTTETEAYVRPGLAKLLIERKAFKSQRVVVVRTQNADLSQTQRNLGQSVS